MSTPTSLDTLQQRRAHISKQISALGDLRSGSITPTTGRCGKPTCHCHRPGNPGHGPNPRLTYKVKGKTVTESLPTPASVRKAKREVAEFRNFEVLHKEFVAVNAQICQLRPIEPEALPEQEKKRSKPSSRKRSVK